MPIACDKCGATTEIPESFRKVPRSFRLGVRTECPRCHAKSQLAGLRAHLWWSLGLGAAGLALVLAFPAQRSGWLLVNLFCFEVFLFVTILPHELGHALVARGVGMRVFKIHVGVGKTLFTRNLLGFHTEFRAIPFGGLTVAAPTDESGLRGKRFAFILAGPLANLLLGGATLLFIPLTDMLEIQRIHDGVVLGQMFLYANVVVLVQNLWPHTFDSPAGRLANDGKQLWQIVFGRNDTVTNLMAARYALEAVACQERRESAAALNWVEEGLTRFPENLLLVNLRGILLIECRQFEASRECFLRLLARADNPPAVRGMLLNNVAYADALLGGPIRLAEADAFSQEAMALLGWMPAIKGTRGTTLLELGQTEEALRLLRDSMEQHDDPAGKAENACFIAIGAAQLGNLVQSRSYLEEARKLAPKCFLLERAEAALAAASIQTPR
jgi:hypothetical protein